MCCKTRSLAGHSSVAQQIRALYHHNQVLERCHLTGNVPWAAPVPSLGNPADVLSEYIFPFRVSHVVPRLLHHLVVCYFCAMCVVSSSDCCMLPLWSEPDPISVLICGRHLMCLLFKKVMMLWMFLYLSLCGSILISLTYLVLELWLYHLEMFYTTQVLLFLHILISPSYTCPYWGIYFSN